MFPYGLRWPHVKRSLAHRLRTTGLGAVKWLVLQPRQNGFNLIAITCSLSKPSSQAQARALWGMGGGGTDIFLRTGEISRGFHVSCLYIHNRQTFIRGHRNRKHGQVYWATLHFMYWSWNLGGTELRRRLHLGPALYWVSVYGQTRGFYIESNWKINAVCSLVCWVSLWIGNWPTELRCWLFTRYKFGQVTCLCPLISFNALNFCMTTRQVQIMLH